MSNHEMIPNHEKTVLPEKAVISGGTMVPGNFRPHYPDYVIARIIRLRKRSGLSQREVAAVLGVEQQTYSAYERGISMMHIREFVRLAKLYDVSVDFITGASDLMGEYPRF